MQRALRAAHNVFVQLEPGFYRFPFHNPITWIRRFQHFQDDQTRRLLFEDLQQLGDTVSGFSKLVGSDFETGGESSSDEEKEAPLAAEADLGGGAKGGEDPDDDGDDGGDGGNDSSSSGSSSDKEGDSDDEDDRYEEHIPPVSPFLIFESFGLLLISFR